MKILLIIISLISPSNISTVYEIQLARPHTHQIEKIQKIGQLTKKTLQF